MSSPLSIFLFLLLISVVPTHSRRRHVINIPSSSSIHPTSLLWDPSSQHFLLPSDRHVITISDASVLESLTLTPSSSSAISSLAIDPTNRRLLVSTSLSLSSFDLRRPHHLLFSTPISIPIAAMAVDPTTSTTFLASQNQILTVDRNGTAIAPLTTSPILENLTAVAFSPRGFLLAVSLTGRVFKIDAEDGVTKEVLLRTPLAGADSVAFRSDGSAIVAGGRWARWVKSNDAWAGAGVYDELEVEEGARVRGAAVRDGRKEYILVGPAKEEEDEGPTEGGWRIEEVEWPSEGDGDMVWGMVLLGLGLAYFLYWRFQMGKLVTSVNKKRA